MSDLVIQGSSWVAMKEQATMLVRSGFLPESIKTPEQAIAIALKGHELGMPMMQAFSQIHVIKGKPTISAEGMNALIRKNCAGAKLEILASNSDRCTIRASRPNEQACEFTFTMDDARRAGITGNPSWSKYPDAMLFARCISIVARRVFPDCLAGISYTPEEMGAEVNAEGQVINITPQEEKKPEAQKGFDRGNPAHVAAIKKALEEKGITDEGDVDAVMHEMKGKASTELDSCIEAMLNYARQSKQEQEIVEAFPIEPSTNPNAANVNEVLDKIEKKLKKK